VVQGEAARVLSTVDLVASPTVGGPALTEEQSAGLGRDGILRLIFTRYWSVVGYPAVALPMGFTADGMPLSMQIAGRPFDEVAVLHAAASYQRATDWHTRRPPLIGPGESTA
jgi:aspartyl-tRNA(Asn)/glutamyl-tRNA(Gln) amidotransferase subunit A